MTDPCLLSRNWPKESVNTFQEHLEAGKPFKIAFLGSNALGEGENPGQKLLRLH